MSLDHWLKTPSGRYVLNWEQAQMDRIVADIFGFHAVQLGLAPLSALAHNRMPHRWLAQGAPMQSDAGHGRRLLCQPIAPSEPSPIYSDPQILTAAATRDEGAASSGEVQGHGTAGGATEALVCDFTDLPFATQSLDLVVLPHTLEEVSDPHACLREVDRVLVAGGQVVIAGFNVVSLWGARQALGRLGGPLFLPQRGEFISPRRVRDWLRLLSFEVTAGRYGCYRPAACTQVWLDRWRFMEKAGDRWWPMLGAAYVLVATKRVRSMRLVGKLWQGQHKKASVARPVAHSRRLP
ncbi:MAG: type 11 methyltransferase [Thiomonas sp. 13-66-29]|nr:methyltransferase domain-containing protein [Thiomonas sp.]OZB44054.1 MAG: type 11 methyltransferase [Thiomonas sp. 15-66-11]OZB62487.1 MAG: type 11 methyltransferase [Thiomonas sp. 13-66-29]